MTWTKEDRSFKTLLGRETTDSAGKKFYNEFGANTINVHADNVWSETIPTNNPSGAVTAGVASAETLHVLTEDTSVPNSQSWKSSYQGWISTKYGDNFTIRVFSL